MPAESSPSHRRVPISAAYTSGRRSLKTSERDKPKQPMRKQKWSRNTAPFYRNYNMLGGTLLENPSPTELLRTLLNFLCARFSFFWLLKLPGRICHHPASNPLKTMDAENGAADGSATTAGLFLPVKNQKEPLLIGRVGIFPLIRPLKSTVLPVTLPGSALNSSGESACPVVV